MSVTTYVVQPGDTLSGLAERFGVSVEALAEANHWARPEALVAGTPLVIPLVPGGVAEGAFPVDGWVPGELAEWPDQAGPPRPVVADRMWQFRLPFPAVTAALVDRILLTLHAFPARPRTGETVTMRLIALNIGPTPVLLRYPTTQRAEFVVTLAGREVFRASAGRVFLPVIREVVLQPGQAEVAVERFVPRAPGEHRITAWNLALPRARLRLSLVVR